MEVNYDELPEAKRSKAKKLTEKRKFDFAEMRIKNKLAAIDSIFRTCKLKEENKERLKQMIKNYFNA